MYSDLNTFPFSVMNTVINPFPISRRNDGRAAVDSRARRPDYDCRDQGDLVELTVYMPGVDPASVEITTRGVDLVVTARKERFVRVNFAALHLEKAQRDYLLCLRLGRGLDFGGLDAELREGVLKVSIPKRMAGVGAPALRRRVA